MHVHVDHTTKPASIRTAITPSVFVLTVGLPVLLQDVQTEAYSRLPPAHCAQDRGAGEVSALRQRRHQVTWRLLQAPECL